MFVIEYFVLEKNNVYVLMNVVKHGFKAASQQGLLTMGSELLVEYSNAL